MTVDLTPISNIECRTPQEVFDIMCARFLAASPSPPPGVGAWCERCQGNGEIVTDWDRYLKTHDGDVGDEAVADCPDCGGTGYVDAAPPVGVEVVKLEWAQSGPFHKAAVAGFEFEILDSTPAWERPFQLLIRWGFSKEKIKFFKTLEEAKDFAQAHVATLVPSPLLKEAEEALKRLARAYVGLLENGRDRILSFGGNCDPVDVMEAGDPALRDAKAVLARLGAAP